VREGEREGVREGVRLGVRLGARLGVREGLRLGAREGVRLGWFVVVVGDLDGPREGEREGERLGFRDGVRDGEREGDVLVGDFVGIVGEDVTGGTHTHTVDMLVLQNSLTPAIQYPLDASFLSPAMPKMLLPPYVQLEHVAPV
jgi:hypothetical protein